MASSLLFYNQLYLVREKLLVVHNPASFFSGTKEQEDKSWPSGSLQSLPRSGVTEPPSQAETQLGSRESLSGTTNT